MWYAPAQFGKLKNNIKTANSETFDAIDTGMKMLYTSVDEGVDLNAKTLGSIVKSFNAFDDVSRANYGAIDDALAQTSSSCYVIWKPSSYKRRRQAKIV